MNKKKVLSIVIIFLIAIAGFSLYLLVKPVNPRNVPSGHTSNQSSTIVTTTTQMDMTCNVNVDDFSIPPLPVSASYNWSELTLQNATSVYVVPPTFSSSTQKWFNPDAVLVDPKPTSTSGTLLEKEWFSPGGNLGDLDNSYYSPLLTKTGWSHEIDISGYKLYGEQAGGYHGEVDGYLKVENGYIRSITLSYLTGAPYPTNLIVEMSDVVPLSQVVPTYEPNCPVISGQ